MSLVMIFRFYFNNAVASFRMFFRILGKIEHLTYKWMFLTTKDIRRIILFRFKIAVMAPLTSAERAKHYWEKNKERVREREALRKKLWRVEKKVSNSEKNKARLLKERLYKREYRKRMKDQPSPISDSTEEGFSQRSSHMRSVRKAEKSLLRSPRKRNAVVSSLAKKFQWRELPQYSQSNSGRPEQDLDADEKSWLIDFLDRRGIMYTTPGKRDQVYTGKINDKKVYETKKYFLWTLNNLLDILNGSEVTGI